MSRLPHAHKGTRQHWCSGIVLLLAMIVTFQSSPAQYKWRKLPGPYGGSWFNVLEVDSSGVVWGATERRLYRSNDSGKTWTFGGIAGASVLALAAGNDGQLMAIADSGRLYRSTNRGASWQRSQIDDQVRGYRNAFITNRGTFLSLRSGSMYRSTDRGVNWKYVGAMRGYRGQICQRGSTLFIASEFFYRSTDDGATWQIMPIGSYVYSNLLIDSEGALRVGGDQFETKHFISTDLGSTWDSVPGPYVNFLVPGRTSNFIGIGPSSVFRFTDGGRSWTRVAQFRFDVNSALRAPDGALQVGTNLGTFRSTDEGATWVESRTSIDDQELHDLIVAGDGAILVGSHGGIYRSSDGGASWSQRFEELPGIFLGEEVPRSVYSFAKDPAGLLFAVAADGIYRSSDHGSTWESCRSAEAAKVVAGRAGLVLALKRPVPSRSFYRSTDGGDLWSSIAPGSYGYSTMVYDGFHNRILAEVHGNGYEGLYPSTDDGSSLGASMFTDTQVGRIYCDPGADRQFRFTDSKNSLYLFTGGGRRQIPLVGKESVRSMLALGNGVYLAPLSSRTIARISIVGNKDSVELLPCDSIPFEQLAIDSLGYLVGITQFDGVYRTTTPVNLETVSVRGGEIHQTPVVAPNPASTAIGVRIDSEGPFPMSVTLLDLLGRPAVSRQLDGPPAGGTLRVPVDALPPGFYVMLLSGPNRTTAITVRVEP